MFHIFRTTNNPLQQRKFKCKLFNYLYLFFYYYYYYLTFTGNCISYPQDIGPITKSLPRRPEDCGILIVKSYNSKGD